ncbi:MAG: hypothetical protein KDE59_17260 [Anaerolineales bacterium]|nr:hypothetical protein [Anaerolineales bacterium]
MQEFLIGLHGGIRWLVVVAGVLALIKFVAGWLSNSSFGLLDRRLSLAFTILMDINVLIGLIIFVTGFFGDLPGEVLRIRSEHAVTMILAVAAAHMSARWKNAADKIRFRQTAIFFLIAMLLVVAGVARVGGWSG